MYHIQPRRGVRGGIFMSSVATAPRDAFGIWKPILPFLESCHPFGIRFMATIHIVFIARFIG